MNSYKLASSKRRDIWVNHTDPSGRNSNGYIQVDFYSAFNIVGCIERIRSVDDVNFFLRLWTSSTSQ